MQNDGSREKDRAETAQIRRLLIVGISSDRVSAFSDSLPEPFQHAEIHSAETTVEARQILDRQAHDGVLVVMGGATAAEKDLRSALAGWPKGTPVVLCVRDAAAETGGHMLIPLADEGTASRRLSDILGEALEQSHSEVEVQPGPPQANVDRFRTTVSLVNHDIKNPLSIISGNAQLLAELAKAMALEEEFGQPIRDIEEASQRIASLLHRLQEVAAMAQGGKRA